MVGPLVVLAVLAVVAGVDADVRTVTSAWSRCWSRPVRRASADGASAGWTSPPMVLPAEHLATSAAIEFRPRSGPLPSPWAASCWPRRSTACGRSTRMTPPAVRAHLSASSSTSGGSTSCTPGCLSGPCCGFPGVAGLDKQGIDWLADGAAVAGRDRPPGRLDRPPLRRRPGQPDRRRTYAVGLRLRAVQTGNVRQYVMLVAVGTVVLFILTSFYWN